VYLGATATRGATTPNSSLSSFPFSRARGVDAAFNLGSRKRLVDTDLLGVGDSRKVGAR